MSGSAGMRACMEKALRDAGITANTSPTPSSRSQSDASASIANCSPKAGRPEAVADACTEALKSDLSSKDRAVLLTTRGLAYFNQRWDRRDALALAIADASHAIQLDDGLADAYALRAVAYLYSGRLEESLSDCNAAINLDPRDAQVYSLRGNVERSLGTKRHSPELQQASERDFAAAKQIEPSVSQ